MAGAGTRSKSGSSRPKASQSLREHADASRAAKGDRAARLGALGGKMQARYAALSKQRTKLEKDSARAHEMRMTNERRAESAATRSESVQFAGEAKVWQQRAFELGAKASGLRSRMARLEKRAPKVGAAMRAAKAQQSLRARADAARAAKGTREQRARAILRKAEFRVAEYGKHLNKAQAKVKALSKKAAGLAAEDAAFKTGLRFRRAIKRRDKIDQRFI